MSYNKFAKFAAFVSLTARDWFSTCALQRRWYKLTLTFLISIFSLPSTASDNQIVDPNEIQLGPIVHESLPDSLLKRIRAVTDVFESVDGISYEQSVALYRRDLNPEDNLSIYEEMARVYSGFCEGRCIGQNEKLEAYRVVLIRSMFTDEEALNQIELNSLSKAEVIELLKAYKFEPVPISVYEEQ